MKRKINLQLLGVAAIAILATLVMAISVFYEIFKQEIIEELRNDARILCISNLFEEEEQKDRAAILDQLRVTIVEKDGTVIFDNYASASQMENHSSRPEIAEALKKGEGISIRNSTTMGQDTFYYAMLQEDGTVLRVAKEADNIWTIFKNVVPISIGIAVCLFIVCIILAHFLTKSMVAPIEQMAKNIESCGNISTYKELVPFITTIQKQHEDIVKGAKMRQEFTANVSHELKTPLTSISGYAEIIESGMADENDTRRFAHEIQRNSNRLLNLINDIIKLSELDAADIKVDFERVNLLEIARESVDMLQMSADKHGVSIHLSGEDCFTNGNKSLLEEVVYNLCDNAIRYNNKGGWVKVIIEQRENNAVIYVKDNGIGISKDNQQRIFERFYRVDKSRSKLTGGTGLGLAIVKHIVSQHNASLEVESDEGKGTQIRVEFQRID